MPKAQVVNTDGTVEVVEPINGTDFSLAECQRFVGGLVELVRLPDGMFMLADEEGLMKSNPVVNEYASAAAGRMIVGDVLICSPSQFR